VSVGDVPQVIRIRLRRGLLPRRENCSVPPSFSSRYQFQVVDVHQQPPASAAGRESTNEAPSTNGVVDRAYFTTFRQVPWARQNDRHRSRTAATIVSASIPAGTQELVRSPAGFAHSLHTDDLHLRGEVGCASFGSAAVTAATPASPKPSGQWSSTGDDTVFTLPSAAQQR